MTHCQSPGGPTCCHCHAGEKSTADAIPCAACAGLQRTSGTPPKHPTSLMSRMSSGSAPATSVPKQPAAATATPAAGSDVPHPSPSITGSMAQVQASPAAAAAAVSKPFAEAEEAPFPAAGSVQRRTSAPVSQPALPHARYCACPIGTEDAELAQIIIPRCCMIMYSACVLGRAIMKAHLRE